MALNRARVVRTLMVLNACLLAGVPALATSARLAALGGNADYLADERAVLRWYATGVDHDGIAVFDLGRFDTGGGGRPWSDRIGGQAGGVHVRFDRDGTWGTAHAYFHTEGVQAAQSQVHADYPGGSFSLGWARNFGALDAALGFRGTTYAETIGGNGTPTQAREDYHHDWGGGLRWRFGDDDVIELAGEARHVLFRLVDDARGLLEPGTAQNGSFGVRARATIGVADGITLVPLLDYSRDVQAIYSRPLADLADLDAWLLRAGIGCRLARTDGERLLFSCEYRDGREGHAGRDGVYRAFDSYEHTWWALHVRAAVESDLNRWLTIRLSLRYRRVDDDEMRALRDVEENEIEASRLVDVPLGVGVTVGHGRFDLDLSYNDRSPVSTPDLPDADAPRDAANFAILSVRYAY